MKNRRLELLIWDAIATVLGVVAVAVGVWFTYLVLLYSFS